MSEPKTPPHVSGTLGIWLSKRAVHMMEFPFRHQLTHQPGGWRLDVFETGKLIARVGDRREAFDVEEGDFVLAAADDLYLSLYREGRDASGRPVPPPDAAKKPEKHPEKKRATSPGRPAKKAATGKSTRKRATKGA
jgi:hypothetical protein